METKNINEKSGTKLSTFSLPYLIKQMKEEESWNKSGRSSKTLQKLNGLRMVLNSMKAGTEIKQHQANGPISVHCIEGQLTFHTVAESVNLRAGEMLSLQEHVKHSVEANEETTFLLTLGSNQTNG